MKKLIISRKDLEHNLKIIRMRLNSFGKDDAGNFPKIIAVVKGNGMGLGLVEYAKFLVNHGVDFLAVANLEEALALRQAGIQEEILMLTPIVHPKELAKLIENQVVLTVSAKEQIETIETIANHKNCEVKAHIKIDTGFGRYGFLYHQLKEILEAFQMCDRLKIEGTYTHFAKPIDEKFTQKQFERFIQVIEWVKQNGQEARYVTCFRINCFFKISKYAFECGSNWFCFTGKNANSS